MIRRTSAEFVVTALLCGIPAVASAQAHPQRAFGRPELLPRDQEIELALSGAPKHLRDRAGVWVLESTGFVEVRPSGNGFTCIVNRDHPLNRKPVCYDREGAATVLPVVQYWGKRLMEGAQPPEIRAEVKAGFEAGKFKSPARSGVAYMMAGGVRVYNPATGDVGTFPPHLMFYAPNLTNDDLGVTAEAMAADPRLPMIGYQGPQGFIIVLLPEAER